MMTTVHTKINEIRQRSKGWSEIYALYFDKEKAIRDCEELNMSVEGKTPKTNYRVYEHTAGDCLINNTI